MCPADTDRQVREYIMLTSDLHIFIESLDIKSLTFSRVLMKSIGEECLRPDALPGVNHMHGMKYKIVLNITF